MAKNKCSVDWTHFMTVRLSVSVLSVYLAGWLGWLGRGLSVCPVACAAGMCLCSTVQEDIQWAYTYGSAGLSAAEAALLVSFFSFFLLPPCMSRTKPRG
jgi:hypothetical protein